ncbi:MAG: hypothetical protein IKU14_10440 [Rhodocyclaceae bacterium]|nr:hypothetical protein [Rhodocyclaceae bacterium]
MMKLRLMLPFALLACALAGCQPSSDAGAPPASAPDNAPPVADEAPAADEAPVADEAPDAQGGIADEEGVVVLYANGFSPAWEAHLTGGMLRFSVPEIGTPDGDLRGIEVSCEEEDVLQCTGKDGEVSVVLELRQEACVKSLNGEEEEARDLSAVLRYGDSRYEGCADAVMKEEDALAPEAASAPEEAPAQ